MFFSGFKLYSVHLNPDDPDPYETAVFVQEGFNWMAFIFHGMWALYHKIWVSGIVLLLAYAAIWALPNAIDMQYYSALVLQLGFRLMVGFEAHDMLRISLTKRGYVVADVVAAASLLEAQQRYFDRRFMVAQQPPAVLEG